MEKITFSLKFYLAIFMDKPSLRLFKVLLVEGIMNNICHHRFHENKGQDHQKLIMASSWASDISMNIWFHEISCSQLSVTQKPTQT